MTCILVMEVAWVLYIWVMVIGIVLGLLFESIWHFQWPWSTVNIMESVADNFMFSMIWPDCHIGQNEAKFTECTFKKCIEIIGAVFFACIVQTILSLSAHARYTVSDSVILCWFHFHSFSTWSVKDFFVVVCFVLSLFISFLLLLLFLTMTRPCSCPHVIY